MRCVAEKEGYQACIVPQRTPVAQRAAGYQRTNLVVGGVMPVATLPGLSVDPVVTPVLEPPEPVAVPVPPNAVPRYEPGLPMA